MSYRIALPLVTSGLTLLALSTTIITFESDALALTERAPWERIVALSPAVFIGVLLFVGALLLCQRIPRHPIGKALLAVACGSLGGTALLVGMPDLVATAPTVLALLPQ